MKAILLLTLCIAVAAQSIIDLHEPHYHSCNSTSDCWDGQCCIQYHPKIDGFCKRLARAGEGCSEYNMCARTPSDAFCPCRGSLVCERNPRHSFPHNTCQVKKT